MFTRGSLIWCLYLLFVVMQHPFGIVRAYKRASQRGRTLPLRCPYGQHDAVKEPYQSMQGALERARWAL